MPDIFRSAGDVGLTNTTRFHSIKAGLASSPTEHFLNSNGSPRNITMQTAAHGLSNILLFARAGADRAVPWTKPDDLAFNNADPLATLGTITDSVVPISFLDGSVALMPLDVSASIFTSIATVKASPESQSSMAPRCGGHGLSARMIQ